jgi:polynucleotide 5'-kinase involved in rRNA processing
VIVNTCGWVEGLGAHLLHEILDLFETKSTQIVQLSSSKDHDVQLANRWVTQIKGELSTQSTFQKGSTSRNRKLWDYLCAKPDWHCAKSNQMAAAQFIEHPAPVQFNLQIVQGKTQHTGRIVFGFVQDVTKDGMMIVTPSAEKWDGDVQVCQSKLFSVQSNQILKHE